MHLVDQSKAIQNSQHATTPRRCVVSIVTNLRQKLFRLALIARPPALVPRLLTRAVLSGRNRDRNETDFPVNALGYLLRVHNESLWGSADIVKRVTGD